MSNKKKKKQSPTQQQYQKLAKVREPKRPIFVNCVRAFFTGGIICTIGQVIQWIYINYFKFDEITSGSPTAATLIFLSVLLTCFGVYDHLAQWGGAGTAIPVTGFANTIASAALEHKSEGFVLGVGGNMFKLAGPVIVYGVFSAFIVALVKVTIKMLGGM
ncbi:MAG TPA: stage V sporulation protein AC [Bacillota bacterium]|nr:stage V sporulation protein AC [Bacillota bacterium]HOR86482.1 stage V sporulation protein AC [Bacillota bacterium]HPL53162.1 stage V sporulation protein AC [Bacillota bacterium]